MFPITSFHSSPPVCYGEWSKSKKNYDTDNRYELLVPETEQTIV